jgi:squalene synthase HpnC
MGTPTTDPMFRDLEPGCVDLSAARAWCADLCRHYENFSLASWRFPAGLRPALQTIYAFARFSDDLADEPLPGLAGAALRSARRRRLEHWARLLEGLPATAGRHPVLLALAHDAPVHGLPLEECRRLLTAFLRDQEEPDFPDDASLLDYCRHSAAPVGRLLLALRGGPRPTEERLRLEAWSDAVCAGLQLANFWQDLSRDLPEGRLYVPRERLARHGLVPDPAALGRAGQAAGPLLVELLDWAWDLLAAADPLSSALRGDFALDVRLFAGGGRAVVRKSRRLGTRLLLLRPRLSAWDKFLVALRAWPALRRTQSAILAP